MAEMRKANVAASFPIASKSCAGIDMIEGFSAIWSSLTEYPRLSFVLFLLIGFGVIFIFTRHRWLETLAGIWRVTITIVTTPFEFLRDALAIVRNAKTAEQDYAQSRIFMLFRYSRLQYLLLLLVSLMILTAGITGALLSFNPTMELQQSEQLREQIKATENEMATAQAALREVEQPGYREALDRTRTQAQEEQRNRQAAYARLRDSAEFSGGIIQRIDMARTSEATARIRNELGSYLEGCPNPLNWPGFTEESCARLSSTARRLLEARMAVHTANEALSRAEQAVENAENARQTARAQIDSLQSRLDFEREQLAAVSVFRIEWFQERLKGAALILLSTALTVVVVIWLSAIMIDVVNWLILMMRSLEISQSEKLNHGRSDYQGSNPLTPLDPETQSARDQ